MADQVATDTCPTCGAAVRVVGSDEGTMHFELCTEAEIRADQTTRIVARLRTLYRDWRLRAIADAIAHEFGVEQIAEERRA